MKFKEHMDSQIAKNGRMKESSDSLLNNNHNNNNNNNKDLSTGSPLHIHVVFSGALQK